MKKAPLEKNTLDEVLPLFLIEMIVLWQINIVNTIVSKCTVTSLRVATQVEGISWIRDQIIVKQKYLLKVVKQAACTSHKLMQPV